MTRYGLLNLNKPTGITSREAVNCVQRCARRAKFGHAGTLDPLASGVLVVCTGAATRLIEYVQRMPKHYTGKFLLGRRSPTDDVQAVVTELDDPPQPSRDQIESAARTLNGTILQRPPAFSALKVRGRRAYDLARRGEQVELEPRPVTVYRLEIVTYDYPQLQLEIECGSGTYVRCLGRDLAESLGTAAVMSDLVRTAIGSFRIDEAIDPKYLTKDNWQDHLLSPLVAVEGLAQITLTADEVTNVRAGRTIPKPPTIADSKEFAALDPSGNLAAILVPRGPGLLGPTRNLPPVD